MLLLIKHKANKITFLLFSALCFCVACTNPKPDPQYWELLEGHNLELMEGEATVNPAKRNLRVISALNDETSDAIIQYLRTGKVARYGYVSSKFYVRCPECKTSQDIIYGFVLVESKLLGINVSVYNASRMPVTTTHRLIVNEAPELEKIILDALTAHEDPETSRPLTEN